MARARLVWSGLSGRLARAWEDSRPGSQARAAASMLSYRVMAVVVATYREPLLQHPGGQQGWGGGGGCKQPLGLLGLPGCETWPRAQGGLLTVGCIWARAGEKARQCCGSACS